MLHLRQCSSASISAGKYLSFTTARSHFRRKISSCFFTLASILARSTRRWSSVTAARSLLSGQPSAPIRCGGGDAGLVRRRATILARPLDPGDVAALRLPDGVDQRGEAAQRVGFLVAILMPIVDALNTGDDVTQKPFGNIRPHASAAQKRSASAA